MSFDRDAMSILHWCDAELHKCGYCKNETGSTSHGLWAECLTIQDYQNMIDRGWRRSGKYCYKPIMNETCCPQYTIRCKVLEFKASKSQKKVIKRFNRYLRDGKAVGGSTVLQKSEGSSREDYFVDRDEDCAIGVMIKDGKQSADAPASSSQRMRFETDLGAEKVNVDDGVIRDNSRGMNDKDKVKRNQKNEVKQGLGADLSKPVCKKAKLLRQERKLLKEATKGDGSLVTKCQKASNATTSNKEKSFQDLLAETTTEDRHKLNIKLISLDGPTWEANKQREFELYKKYQVQIHGDEVDKCSMMNFERFLVNSPLESTNRTFGSFHQQYWIDNQLIAVGVIDILPTCVSSVYFFYDPDYNYLTLGTYSSLREINFTQQLHLTVPSISYYYMGFYIHTCPKMLYKGKLRPSYLLCPETYHWVPVEVSVAKLDIAKYSRLAEDPCARDEEMAQIQDMTRLKLINRNGFTYLRNYNGAKRFEQVFRTLGVILGKKLIDNVFIVDLQ